MNKRFRHKKKRIQQKMSLFRILELGVVGELKVGVVVSVERGVKGGCGGE